MLIHDLLLETVSPFWVLVYNGEAKVLPEDSFREIRKLEEQGWEVVWDSAPTAEEGYVYASRNHNAIPHGYDDKFQPIGPSEPKVLYRSVSIPELIDILKTGKVVGRQNRFNGFDPRRFVFFADTLTDKVIGQGEEIDRQAMVAMENDPIHQEFDALEQQLKELTKREADAVWFAVERNPRLGEIYQITSATYAAFLQGDEEAERAFSRAVHRVPAIAKLAQQRLKIYEKLNKLREKYRTKHRKTEDQLRAKWGKSPYSSAVIVTKPVGGGLHYSHEHGKSGMGQEDEYGFLPGRVTWEDIDKVILMKAGQPVKTVSYDEAEAELPVLMGLKKARAAA